MWIITHDLTDWAAYAAIVAPNFMHPFHKDQLSLAVGFPLQVSSTDSQRRCCKCGKIGANATSQLQSFFWIGSSDSFYNPNGQVFPWQQLALSWAGKAYKQMITWVKKTLCVKCTQGILPPLLLWRTGAKIASKSSQAASKMHQRHKVDTTQWAWSDLGSISR